MRSAQVTKQSSRAELTCKMSSEASSKQGTHLNCILMGFLMAQDLW